MVRSTGRKDGNHDEIVAALEAAGCSVVSLASAGRSIPGLPDLLVGRFSRMYVGHDLQITKPIHATALGYECEYSGPPHYLSSRRNILMEIKDGSKPPSKRKLTKDEARWHMNWRGQYAVVESVADALRVCGLGEG